MTLTGPLLNRVATDGRGFLRLEIYLVIMELTYLLFILIGMVIMMEILILKIHILQNIRMKKL